MSDAIYSGLLSRQNRPSDVTGNCTTERCDWDPYWTLAVCPTVEDVTSRILSVDPGTVEGVSMKGHRIANGTYYSFVMVSDSKYSQSMSQPRSNITIGNRGTISDTLLFWYPPCSPDFVENLLDQQYWRAHRATLSLCLQKLNSSFYNSSMHTEVIESKIDVAWRNETINASKTYDICGDSPDATHCVQENYIRAWSYNLWNNGSLNGSASLVPGGDNYYRPTEIRRLAIDVLGLNPTECSNDTSIGFAGFEKRIQNIAVSMSNA